MASATVASSSASAMGEEFVCSKNYSSLLQGESFELFSVAIRSPATRDPYERKLLGFLKRINMSPDDFVLFVKGENPSAAGKKIISLL